MRSILVLGSFCIFCFFYFFSLSALCGSVEIKNNQLFVDDKPQPQLYGAELQYFRLRGGYGPNIPRAQVIALWNEALDRMVEAKMNAISFYIPWDFHEYAEGKFDFTGSVDEDGDGNPDYPSRDLVTFLKLVEAHGIHNILVRPGPYINAEWGFLGFGAVPLWFHEKFPGSHMQGQDGRPTKLYDYQNADFRRYSQIWLSELYRQVLSHWMGPGKPITFLQLDNETNFMWQSLYNHDYSPSAITRYQSFLKNKYASVQQLNQAQGTNWNAFADAQAPTKRGPNTIQDQDWYQFHDESMHEYLAFVRKIWEGLGVKEPEVLFTLAESYNAAQDGILPNYRLRNDPGVTGMMTVNMYPKTEEASSHPLMNNPFKMDHDVKAVDEAKKYYLGKQEEWAMGPEIQAGWWQGIPVSDLSRKQTYLSVLGHGLKAMFLYYFNEGENWDADWQQDYKIKLQGPTPPGGPRKALGVHELYFDAPLDKNAKPSAHYALVREIGEKLIAPYQDFLAAAVEVMDPVCLLKNVEEHVPNSIARLDSLKMNSDWAGGLLGYLMQSGINPSILHWGLSEMSRLDSCRLILHQDNGIINTAMIKKLQSLVLNGATVINLLNDSVTTSMGISIASTHVLPSNPPVLHLSGGAVGSFAASIDVLFHYDLRHEQRRCHSVLQESGKSAGYACTLGQGQLIQWGSLFYDEFNSDNYTHIGDVHTRSLLLQAVLTKLGIQGQVQIKGGGDRLVAFARTNAAHSEFWVTVRNSKSSDQSFAVQIQGLSASHKYQVKNLFSGRVSTFTGKEIQNQGFSDKLASEDSTVYFVQP